MQWFSAGDLWFLIGCLIRSEQSLSYQTWIKSIGPLCFMSISVKRGFVSFVSVSFT